MTIAKRLAKVQKEGFYISLSFYSGGSTGIYIQNYRTGIAGKHLAVDFELGELESAVEKIEKWADEQKESPINEAENITEDSNTDTEASQGGRTFDE